MQIKPQLVIKYAFLITAVCFYACRSAPANNDKEIELKSSFKTAHTEKQRLGACIAGIDHQLIHVGMSVSDLDNFLGSEFAKEIPIQESDEHISAYKFGKREYAWRLVAQFNGKGRVIGYYLNNLTQKGYSSTELPSARVKDIAAAFQRAKVPSQKLACAIHAIDSRVIGRETLKGTLYSIFGNIAEEREPRSGWYIRSFVFGTGGNSWRLITNGDSDHIYGYFLTNFNCDPWGLKHWGL
jgi:hypothetical protein